MAAAAAAAIIVIGLGAFVLARDDERDPMFEDAARAAARSPAVARSTHG